jgi:peptidoglycan hydrolase-like protein with peptidoglycan-binding domain
MRPTGSISKTEEIQMFSINRSLWTRMVVASLMTGLLALVLSPLACASKSRDDIQKAQQALAEKGYNPGPIDGVMGHQTRQAIGQYQKAENLPVTNHLNDTTADRLGVPRESPGGAFKEVRHDVAKGGKEFGHDIKKL